MQQLSALFEKHFSVAPAQVSEIANSASNRRYFRLTAAGAAAIGVIGTQMQENYAFVQMARHFKAQGLNVPTVYEVSDDFTHYLQEDLGSESLFSLLGTEKAEELLQKTIAKLPEFQFKGAQGLDFELCFPYSDFDRTSIMWDLNYFKYDFLKPYGLEFNEWELEKDFNIFTDLLLKSCTDAESFLYRDFQSRNVMISSNEPWFIDFQGGRKGPFYYDLVSFVYQSKAAFSAETRQKLIDCYFAALQPYCAVSREEFDRNLPFFVLFRCLQTLGAYGFRGLVERKANFISSVPFGIRNLSGILDSYDYGKHLPYLTQCLKKVVESYKAPIVGEKGRLTVKVYSFSYKKGIPEDYSGNGGGFVFDCRSVHNPGKYEQYKSLTGLDEPVAAFLERESEMPAFMQNVFAIADASVRKYAERGFTDLMFSFGCTGGQHRSVYGAQALAKYIAGKYPSVRVYLCHRERGIEQYLNWE